MWYIRSRQHAFAWTGDLVAHWEVAHDPISDDYTPDEISAHDLLVQWGERVKKEFPNGLIPIYWYVESPGHAKFERMPFQYPHLGDDEHFLTLYFEPETPDTRTP